MQNLVLAVNVVLPLFLLMCVGYFLRWCGLMDGQTSKKMNTVCFRAFMSVMMFYNIYTSDLDTALDAHLLIFAVVVTLLSFGVHTVLMPRFVREPAQRGVIIQGCCRSNFVLFGLPVTVSLFGQEQAAVASILIAVVVPCFNVLSVFVLAMFQGGKTDGKQMLLAIAKNPLILGTLVGILSRLLHISYPSAIVDTARQLTNVATPLALVILGSSLQFEDFRRFLRPLTFTVLSRLVLVPLAIMNIALFLGLRGAPLGAMLAMSASPTAVSSFTMAQEMGGDAQLASQIVMFTTLCSILTMSLWIFALKQMGVI